MKNDLERKIKELEERVKILEGKPIVYPIQVQPVVQPIYIPAPNYPVFPYYPTIIC